MKTKTIPFNLETAKKIQAGEIEGKVTRNGREIIILDYNSKRYSEYPIRFVYLDSDEVDYTTYNGLYIEVPDNNEQLFKPFEKVLVRDYDDEEWVCGLFSHYIPGTPQPYACVGNLFVQQCIPYEGNQELVGTTNELDK